MNEFFRVLRRSDPRLIVISTLLLIGVGFAVFKMVGAFSIQEERPAYEQQPAPGFSSPLSETLIEPRFLEAKRLPDELYTALAKTTQKLAVDLSNNQLTVKRLTALGVERSRAQEIVTDIEASKELYSDRQIGLTSEVSLESANATAAELIVPIRYSEGTDGQPPATGTLTARYSRSNDRRWKLDLVTYEIG